MTVIYLLSGIACTTAGVIKLVASRKDKELSLKVTAWTILIGGQIFWLTLPTVYHAVGEVCHSASLATLLTDSTSLIATGLAHLLTQLFHPLRREPPRLRRTLLTWVPFYAATLIAMTALFFSVDLKGPSHPLHFVVAYGHIPQIFAMQTVFLTCLTISTTVVALQFRGLTPPGTPLAKSVRSFTIAVALDVVKAVFTLAALISASSGFNHLNFLADLAWVVPPACGLVASYGLVSFALASRRAEKHDADTLEPLWDLVQVPEDHAEADDEPTSAWRQVLRAWWRALSAWWKAVRDWARWGWDVRFRLNRLMIEIRDGEDNLSPWMSPWIVRQVADAVASVKELVDSGMGTDGPAQLRLAQQHNLAVETVSFLASNVLDEDQVIAMQAAATILDAALARAAGNPPVPQDQQLTTLPGQDVPAAGEREYLVRVAQQLAANPLIRSLARNHLPATPVSAPGA
ncbi:hypothetical protein ABZ864_40645 [Streptomyces sp. NPDC047082]|uniref:hypothetical protein n=1 Tax=Streptomyces sp. NPDC047082 TaxID=3155259 RepID=UPI00340011D7